MKTLQILCFFIFATVSLGACAGKTDDSTKASSTVVAATSGSIPECDAYLDRVSKCAAKLGEDSAMAATYRQQVKAAAAQWATMHDKTALADICKQANDAFTQSTRTLKCE